MPDSKYLWTNTAPGEITMNANNDFVIKIEPGNSEAGSSLLLLVNKFTLFYKGKEVFSMREDLSSVKSCAEKNQDQLIEFGLAPRPPEEALSPSLVAKLNISLRDQTLDQLITERDYWQKKIDGAKSWGASVSAALEFRDACNREIRRRQIDTK